jgi:phenylacetate-coenzyme A ligase PaaK-like adenylate-forming protein
MASCPDGIALKILDVKQRREQCSQDKQIGRRDFFKTGGTTGNENYVALSEIELQQTSMQLASGLLAAGVKPDDRVANVFFAGEL